MFKVYNVDLHKVVRKYIETKIAPFKAGDIIVTVTDDTTFKRIVRVDIEALPNNPCVIKDYRLWTFDRGPEFLATEIGFRAAKHYSSIPALPVSDNVILGEN